MRGVAVLAQRANPNADPLEAAQALWTKYGLNIDALARAGEAGADGLQFEQALASQPPKGWKHSTDGADAVALWEGQSEHRAVFWTDMKGKLEQDAPARAGYSHSVDVSALGHIRREHGDVESEAQRGQAAITERDIAAIPEIVTSYDAVRQVTDKRGRPIIAYAKRIGDGVTVYLEEVSDRRRNLRGVSMRRYLTSSDAGAILERTVRDELNALSERSIPAHEQTVDEGGAKFNQAAAPNMDKRGSLQIGADRRMRISLFEKANFSTFLHETGHFYLEVLGDLAENADSDQALRDDYAKILKWLRVNNRGEITREHHEKWARANEAYLMEGKAPTPELRGVFQRFAAWLRLIYRQLDALRAPRPDFAGSARREPVGSASRGEVFGPAPSDTDGGLLIEPSQADRPGNDRIAPAQDGGNSYNSARRARADAGAASWRRRRSRRHDRRAEIEQFVERFFVFAGLRVFERSLDKHSHTTHCRAARVAWDSQVISKHIHALQGIPTRMQPRDSSEFHMCRAERLVPKR